MSETVKKNFSSCKTKQLYFSEHDQHFSMIINSSITGSRDVKFVWVLNIYDSRVITIIDTKPNNTLTLKVTGNFS